MPVSYILRKLSYTLTSFSAFSLSALRFRHGTMQYHVQMATELFRRFCTRMKMALRFHPEKRLRRRLSGGLSHDAID